MCKQNKKYGVKGILSNYGWKNFFKDSWVSLLAGIVVGCLSYRANFDSYSLIENLLSNSLVVIPIIITLILTSYTIFISLFSSNRFYTQIRPLNSIFTGIVTVYSASIIISIFALGLLFVTYVCCKMEVTSHFAKIINNVALVGIVACIVYPFISLINIIIEIFNSGMVSLNLGKLSDEDLQSLKEDAGPS